jgi:beta-lactamase regulating signal transducer with metallopeptidase domain
MMFFQGVTEIVAERALNSIPAGLLIASLAWIGLRAFKKQDSAIRFAVWFLALVGIAAVPFVPTFGGSAGVPSALHARVTLPAAWADAIFCLWVAVVGLVALRLCVGIWKLRSLKRHAAPIAFSDLPVEAQQAIAEFRASRPVEVCSSTRVRIPTALGFFRPTVLLPEWAVIDLSEQDLTAVILHELAHLHRKDDWTNLAQKFLGALFFFHPAVWWVERRLALEREMACDELVLAKTGNRYAYAECLVSLAEKSFARHGIALAQALIGHATSTALRLARILDPSRAATPRSYAPALTFASAVLVLCVAVAPGGPRLIAFQNRVVTSEAAHAAMDVGQAARLSHQSEARMVGPDWTGEPPVPHVKALQERTALQPVNIEASFHPERLRTQPAALQKTVPAAQRPAPARELLARETGTNLASRSRTQFVVFMQTSIDGDGEVKTDFCVWKLTLRESDNRAIRAQIITSSL